MARYFPDSDYFGPGKKPPEATWTEQIPTVDDVVQKLQQIFNGQPGEESKVDKYRAETDKIAGAEDVIATYLLQGNNVPAEVKQLFSLYKSDRVMAERFLDLCGPLKEQDPNVINRFYKDMPLSLARAHLRHKWVGIFVKE